MERKNLLHNVQKTGFAMHEANLYLDAYPNCEEALAYFKERKAEHMAATAAYEENCGPLTVTSCENDSWQWVKTPWPWELGVN